MDNLLANDPRTHSAGAAPPRASSRMAIRNTTRADIPAIRDLQRRTYPTIPEWTEDQVLAQIDRFPEGQLVAQIDGEVVGAASSLIVQWNDYAVDHTWKGVTGGGTFCTHDPGGLTLYGAEVVVAAGRRGRGIGRALYQARSRLCRGLNLKRIIAAGRIPGYRRFKDVMAPELYAMRVVWGDIPDPVLRFQLANGFHYCGIIHNYLPEDDESCGNAALVVWLNPRHAPRAAPPPPPPPREAA